MVATAVAIPFEEKRPLGSAPISQLNNNKPPLTSDPKAQIPSANPPRSGSVPITKRDTPKATDQKPSNTPVTNTQKTATAQNPSSSVIKPSNNRPSRDTQKPQNSYNPQPSGVPQKSNSAPLPSNTDSKISNNRPSRDTPKASAPAPTEAPKKNNSPITPNDKPQQNSRNRRDTVKQADNQKPVEWNKNQQTKTNTPSQQPSSLNPERKTRETPKKNDNDKSKSPNPAPQPTVDRKTRETPKNTPKKDDKTKTSNPTQPEVSKVPLTSTNARNRRDAPNPIEQSKLVPSGSISGKANPSEEARTTTTARSAPLSHKRDTEKQPGIRYPVPVDQVLKQKENEKPVADK